MVNWLGDLVYHHIVQNIMEELKTRTNRYKRTAKQDICNRQPAGCPKFPQRSGERSNKTIREEFYNSHNKKIKYCTTTKELDFELQKHIEEYNTFRPHQALDFKTPMEYYNYQKMKVS